MRKGKKRKGKKRKGREWGENIKDVKKYKGCKKIEGCVKIECVKIKNKKFIGSFFL